MYRIAQKLKKKIFYLFMTGFISASVVFFTPLASLPTFYTKDIGSGLSRTEKCSSVSCCEDCNVLFPTLNSI